MSIGFYGHRLTDNWTRWLFAIGIPLIAVILWGVFAIPQDPSRSGNAPIPVAGWLRLILEIIILGFGVYCLWKIERPYLASLFLIFITIHYLLSYDRIIWMLKQ